MNPDQQSRALKLIRSITDDRAIAEFIGCPVSAVTALRGGR